MVTLALGATLVPAAGLCLTTVFAAAVDVASVLTTGVSPAFVSLFCAVLTSSPTTPGTLTCRWPADRKTLTTLLAGTIVPQAGFVPMTWPFATDAEFWLLNCGCRCWATI